MAVNERDLNNLRMDLQRLQMTVDALESVTRQNLLDDVQNAGNPPITRIEGGSGIAVHRSGGAVSITGAGESLEESETTLIENNFTLERDVTSGEITQFCTIAARKIIVGLAWVTVTNGTASWSTCYDAVSTAANRFFWIDVTNTGGADTATLEKGAAFPDPPASQNVVTPVVHSYIPMWEIVVNAARITSIVEWYSWPRLDTRA